MICTDRRLRLCKVLLAAVLIFIWGNSALPAEVSQAFSDWVKSLLSFGSSGGGQGSGLLRKIAHFTEFAALGLLLTWLLGMLKKRKIAPFLWGVAAACIDETIQMFVPGRAPRMTDVLIDSCGVATGLGLLYLGHAILKKRSTNHHFGGK